MEISGDLLAVMKMRPASEWQDLFKMLLDNKFQQLLACETDSNRACIQFQCLQIKSLEQFFLSEMQRK